jgi:hypothetical protein
MATGENLFSHQDARNLLRYAGMRPDRGLATVRLRCHTDSASTSARSPHWRSRAGRRRSAFRMEVTRCRSTSPPARSGCGNESYPDLFQPYGGFPDGVRVEDSRITMPDLPGIGFEGKPDLIEGMRNLSE